MYKVRLIAEEQMEGGSARKKKALADLGRGKTGSRLNLLVWVHSPRLAGNWEPEV